MKTNLVLLLALSVGVFGKMAVAQSPAEQVQVPQVQYAVFHPDQDNATLQLTNWDDRHCERERDCRERDNRWRDERWRNDRNNGNWNNGYYGNTAAGNYRNGQRGDYGPNGDFHPFGSNGYYDRNGNWHNGGGWWR
jgi:hypothetical protein